MVTVACRLLAVHFSRFSLKVTVFDSKHVHVIWMRTMRRIGLRQRLALVPFCLAATLWEQAHLEYSMNLKRKGGLEAV